MARIRPSDLMATDEERRLAQEQAEAESYAGTGAGIGGIAGGALGALGFLAGPAVGAATVGLGSSLGGGIGGAIGGKAGSDKMDSASRKLAELEKKRQGRLASAQLRQQALDALQGLS